MSIILCAINNETGEVLNRDGSVAGKVVPLELDPAFVESQIPAMFDTPENAANPMKRLAHVTRHKRAITERHQAMLITSKVDLSGCEVKK